MAEYSEEQKNCAAKILEIKTPIEANIVLSLYKEPDLLLNYDFKVEDFLIKSYKILFEIISGMVLREKTREVNEISIGMFLEAYPALKETYEEIGGWETIQMGFNYNISANFESDYFKNIKYNVLIKLLQTGFPVYNHLEVPDKYGRTWIDKDIQEIYEDIDSVIQKIFIKANANFKVEDLTDNGKQILEDWDKGLLVGLPFKGFPILTQLTGGMLPRDVILFGAPSNTGKSSFVRCMVLPSLMDKEEPSLTILNEENREKWLREELIYIANNIYKRDINKNVVKNGHFNDENKAYLYESLEWLEKMKEKKLMNFVSFPQYSTSQAIKTIKQSSNNGIKTVIIDTFKVDNDRASSNVKGWELLKDNMVNLYNVAREREVCVLATCQLNTDARYLSRNYISESKGIIESVSTAIFMRTLWSDEYPGEKNAIEVYKMDGQNKNQKTLVTLDKDKTYVLLFVDKSREGAARTIQVVVEVDWARNVIREIGFTKIPYTGVGDSKR